ncbi:MAG: 2-amino-4-hydroxy-6-hydroxymethyldihydropteridine diphosphokinase [Pseudorhodobacter sp.]|nr:2-amino-4-hydroxy-6-hydroxymethyldihydropteridine diphosphokinase [Pseudorhodobacter sp.]
MRNFQQMLIALGANLESGAFSLAETLRSAAKRLVTPQIRVAAISRLFASPCFPAGAGPDYINAAAVIETTLSPQAVLAHLHAVEAEFRRERLQRWGQRTLDLDLVAVGDLVLPDLATQAQWRNLPPADQPKVAPDRLILPHPRVQDRAFVLVPLADIAPDWRHPVLGLTVTQMLANLDPADIRAVTPL